MSSQPRAAQNADRSILESPIVAALLFVVVVALAGVVLLPGLLGGGPAATPSPRPSATVGATPTSPVATFVRPTPSPQPTFLSHVVRTGETLTSIARQYGTTARSIAWWNRGAYPSLDPESAAYDPNRLEVGWVLVLIPNTVVDDLDPPTPSPGPTGTPAPSATVSPASPTSAPATPRPTQLPATPAPTATPAPATVVTHGPRTVPRIALTFDMGGRLAPAHDIVQWLIDHDVHATFFPTGKTTAETSQGRAAMELAATRPDLFDFGNHSWDHPDFRDLTKSQMATQLRSTEQVLKPIVGTTKPWFRPPFGGWNAKVQAGVGAAGWKTIVLWDVDTIDWRPVDNDPPGPTAAQIVAKIRDNARGGSIVLLHLGGWNTLEALPGILDACDDLGLQPVTLTELLGG